MFVRRVVAAAALLLVAPGLAGCGGDEDPEPKFTSGPESSDTASSSPSPSESQSPAADEEPTPPPEMDGDDEAAAEAFIRYYFDEASYAVMSGDVSTIKSLAAPVCAACRGFTGAVETVHEKGGEVTGGEFIVLQLDLARRGEIGKGATLFDSQAEVEIAAQTIQGTGDAQWDGRSPRTRVHYEVQVSHSKQAGWRMLEWAEKQ